MGDLQTELKKLELDWRRSNVLQLDKTLIFEKRDSITMEYTELGRISSGWCLDNNTNEALGGASDEYNLTVAWSASNDSLVQQCTTITVDGTRYEKRAVVPAFGSPAVISMRVQTISGYARVS